MEGSRSRLTPLLAQVMKVLLVLLLLLLQKRKRRGGGRRWGCVAQ